MKSIYEQIDDAVRMNACIPDGFVLVDALKPGEKTNIHLGSDEGVIGHPVIAPEETELECAVKIIKEAVKINAKLAVHGFDDNVLGFKVARVRGLLLKKIIDDIQEFDPHKLSTLAYSLAMFGTKVETVKLGLLLLVLFDFADDEVVKKHLITLGMYEEFTSYVISNVKSWPEGSRNHVYYVYARKLRGWGKINAVECLEPINDEIKEWILCKGCDNEVGYRYLAATAYEKSGLSARLKEGGLSEEQMQGARDIMRGLLEDEKNPGIASIDNPALLAMRYFKELSDHSIALEDIVNMYQIKDYFANIDKASRPADKDMAISIIDRLIALSDAEKKIREGVLDKPELSVPIAAQAGIDIADPLMECVVRDFDTYYRYGYYFLIDCVYVDEFIAICERNLEGRNFKEGMGLDTVTPDDENIWHLDLIVQYLSRYPEKGIKLITTSIGSSVLRFRTVAATVIQDWETERGENIKKISSDIFHAVKKVKKKEAADSLKKIWDDILSFK
ncbi:MAG: hypothetical protein K5857_10775 [Lachnospiraceae bacterium]|nr:hypothetical protein [Lachnospiraceae bacterium]